MSRFPHLDNFIRKCTKKGENLKCCIFESGKRSFIEIKQKLAAGIFYEIGLLPYNELVEVGRADLVAKYRW